MKLNYKRTFLVGLAFLGICIFWQFYTPVVALALVNKYGLNQTWSNVILSLDKGIALFLLPLFGALSDKTDTKITRKFGKRTPFVVLGTCVAVLCLLTAFGIDASQTARLEDISDTSTCAAVLAEKNSEIDNPYYNKSNAPAGFNTGVKRGRISEIYSGDFAAIKLTADSDKDGKQLFSDVVIPVRNAYAAEVRSADAMPFIGFLTFLILTVFAMASYRSQAIAIMPAVTVKPLRSQGNAVINVMGVIGGLIVLALGTVFATGNTMNGVMSYFWYALTIAGIMVVSLGVFLLTVREPKLVEEMETTTKKFNLDKEDDIVVDASGKARMGKNRRRSFIFLLLSIFLWFFGYNAVSVKYAVYAQNILSMDYNLTLMIAQAAGLIIALPAGFLGSKFGRKRTIMVSGGVLAAALGFASFITPQSSVWFMNLLFVAAGFGWTTIIVNSLPMVVDMATGADVGQYTGYYYTASMSAQLITPIVSGILMDAFGMKPIFFPYGAIFVALSVVSMVFVKHGDSKISDATAAPETEQTAQDAQQV